MPDFKVLIIGAGLAGSLLANGLILHGIDCVLYERDARSDSEEIHSPYRPGGRGKREGYQIRLGANALAGLRACLTSQQFEDCIKLFGRSGGLVSSAPVLYDTHFANVLQDLTKFPAYTKSAPINRVVLQDFLQEPVDRAGKLRYGKSFRKYEIIEEGQSSKVRVHFSDGTTDEGDVLVSAEGSGSKVNMQVGLNNIVQLTESVGFLAKGNLPKHKLQTLPSEIKKGPVSSISGGKILFFSSEWEQPSKPSRVVPGLILLPAYLPPPKEGQASENNDEYNEDEASMFWALTVPSDCLPPGGVEAIEDKTEFCIQQISDWSPKFHTLLRAADDEDVYVLKPRASKKPANDWRRKALDEDDIAKGHPRVWLMGDAVHPMLPGRGMGGNQAMRDAEDLLKELQTLAEQARSGHTLSDDDAERSVLAYENCMIPRAFKWVQKSGGLGEKLPDPDSFAGQVGLFVLARFLDAAYMYTSIRKYVLGYAPQDDAPELPD